MTDITELLINLLTEKSSNNNSKSGATKRELIKETGLSSYKLTRLLYELADQGKIEAVAGRKPNIAGTLSPTVLYRLINQDTPTPGE